MTVARSGKTCSDVSVRTLYHPAGPSLRGERIIATSVLMRKIRGIPRIGMKNAAYFERTRSTTKTTRGVAMRKAFVPLGASGSEARISALGWGKPPLRR